MDFWYDKQTREIWCIFDEISSPLGKDSSSHLRTILFSPPFWTRALLHDGRHITPFCCAMLLPPPYHYYTPHEYSQEKIIKMSCAVENTFVWLCVYHLASRHFLIPLKEQKNKTQNLWVSENGLMSSKILQHFARQVKTIKKGDQLSEWKRDSLVDPLSV